MAHRGGETATVKRNSAWRVASHATREDKMVRECAARFEHMYGGTGATGTGGATGANMTDRRPDDDATDSLTTQAPMGHLDTTFYYQKEHSP